MPNCLWSVMATAVVAILNIDWVSYFGNAPSLVISLGSICDLVANAISAVMTDKL